MPRVEADCKGPSADSAALRRTWIEQVLPSRRAPMGPLLRSSSYWDGTPAVLELLSGWILSPRAAPPLAHSGEGQLFGLHLGRLRVDYRSSAGDNAFTALKKSPTLGNVAHSLGSSKPCMSAQRM